MAFRGENLRLERTIATRPSFSEIELCDNIENYGYKPEPLTMIYYMIFGFLLLLPNAEIIAPIKHTEGYDEISGYAESLSVRNRFSKASLSPEHHLFRHERTANEIGETLFLQLLTEN